MGKILIIDDDEGFVRFLHDYIEQHYRPLVVETCTDAVKALGALNASIDLLILDFEMPNLDGMKILRFALQAGIDKNRVVILSGRDADYLHDRCPMGTCLAVLNKHEAKQKAVLDMIFQSLQKKAAAVQG
ncbi:MAG TPA: response regulator [Verrucomicrobiae bacterium]|nr:response regulator [Verrucomicrobiae bacterium]